MTMQAILGSILAYLDGLERVLDYDPMETHGRRLAALERRFDELAAHRQNGSRAREPSFEGANWGSPKTGR